jgi:hypothetical protein
MCNTVSRCTERLQFNSSLEEDAGENILNQKREKERERQNTSRIDEIM